MATATETKKKATTKNVETKEPAKKKISKFGQMANSYAGKIIEHGSNIWDL